MSEEKRTIVMTFVFINGMKKQVQFHNTTKLSVMEEYIRRSGSQEYAHIDLGIVYLDKVLYVDFEEY
ncbi:hypothetical protein E0485_03305 [Paenibacillus albiflavus]|uniref:Uncharacterized protein n=1 Tax=Paenibacillus albiflavus TaxID=2545760 RepID=A0A4R4EJ11_9BACL|nr:hypothetical protein [Paenibacillus albiflavus]TCZ79909.1 hypothetical protein E0485_03305 [Paenibacillus albiflavus]